MRPPGAILAPGESIIATGNDCCILCSYYCALRRECILAILCVFPLYSYKIIFLIFNVSLQVC
jgi:hypothetical protein